MHREKNRDITQIPDHLKNVVTRLQEVDFFFCDFDYCRFRRTEMQTVDFRYSHVRDCTMGECCIRLGDFYFCAFQGCTNFVDSTFLDCSFTCATFENDCIRMNNIPKGIVQEHSHIYHYHLTHAKRWIRYHPCASFCSMNHAANEQVITAKSEAYIALEASNFYKVISGVFAGKGLNRDSNEAYRKSKKSELIYLQKIRKFPKDERDISRGEIRHRIFNIRVTQALGYGYKWQAPTFWFLFIVVGFGIVGLCKKTFDHNILDNTIRSFCYSLYNSMAPHEEFSDTVSLPWASFESVAGVLLIGFLGFIIANNIRNDS